MKNIEDKLITIIVKEHSLKKRLLFANIQIIMEMMDTEDKVELLVPTMINLINVTLKNDDIILKLIEMLKKHAGNTKKYEDDEEDDSSDEELLKLINQEPQEIKQIKNLVSEKLKNTGFEDQI